MVDLRSLAECVQGIVIGNLAGARHIVDVKTLAPGPSTHGPGAQSRPARRRSPGGTFSALRTSTEN